MGGFSTIASKATEVGQKSWGGLSSFVNSPSLQNFTAPFGSKRCCVPVADSFLTSFFSQYDDLSPPTESKQFDKAKQSEGEHTPMNYSQAGFTNIERCEFS